MAIEVLKNNNTIEVTPSVGKMSISTLNQGFDNEKKIFKFSGRVKKNTPTTIGEINYRKSIGEYDFKIIGTGDESNLHYYNSPGVKVIKVIFLKLS